MAELHLLQSFGLFVLTSKSLVGWKVLFQCLDGVCERRIAYLQRHLEWRISSTSHDPNIWATPALRQLPAMCLPISVHSAQLCPPLLEGCLYFPSKKTNSIVHCYHPQRQPMRRGMDWTNLGCNIGLEMLSICNNK